MKVVIANEQSWVEIDESQVEKLVLFVCESEGLRGDELSVNFVSKETICDLHKSYFDDPSPTDCITCPIDGNKSEESEDPHHVIGEVFICPEVGKEVCPENPLEEISLYIVHTLLHLAGYKDLEEDDIAEMRAAEKRILHTLSEKNLMLSNQFLPIN